MKLGILIPEFPGQTHSFFWREIVELRRRYGLDPKIFSTRLPARPVQHEWVAEAQAEYLYPLGMSRIVALAARVLPRLPRLLADGETLRLLVSPKIWGFLLLATRLADLCRAHGISHLHVHSCGNAALIAAFCNRLHGVRYSLTLHGPLEDYGPHQAFKWRHADFVFVITETLRRDIVKALPESIEKVAVVPMGVDTERFRPPAIPRPRIPETFHWFCSARLNLVKGHETVSAAAAIVREQRPDLAFRIHVAGEDEQGGIGYRKVIERDIAERGLTETLVLLGAVSQAQVLAGLQNADGFVLASRREPLGVAYMEAMACGLPTIGTKAGGVEELIDDSVDGLLVAPGDPEALAAAMLDVMTHPDLRAKLAVAARQKIVTGFGANRSADALAMLLSTPDTLVEGGR